MLEYKYFILNYFDHVGLIVLVLIAYHYLFCSSRNKSQVCTCIYIYIMFRLPAEFIDGRMAVIFYSRSGEGATFILLSEKWGKLKFQE